MATSVCAKCHDPLVVEVDADEQDQMETGDPSGSGHARTESTVPDDVALACGDHMHWDCLMEADAYELNKCPVCAQSIGDGSTVLVDYRNEGGLQQGLDIFPMLREEAYLRAYPDEQKCRAFLELCKEGDHRAIAALLHSCDEDSDNEDEDDMADSQPILKKSMHEVLRYQDPIADMQSGLHCAVANGHREVAWLLLLLASELPELDFPALVYQEAAALGVMREDQTGKVDIRSLRDSRDRTAEDVAKEVGVIWNGWIGNHRLRLS